MKKLFNILLIVSALAATSLAQGTLQFNQVLLVTNVQQSVPAGKVWKVTAVYGEDNKCFLLGPCYTALSPQSYAWAEFSGFEVDGVSINSGRSYIPIEFYTDANCSQNARSWTTGSCASFAKDLASNPNILPFWLGAGKTLKSSGAGVFLSVVEFNVIP